MIKITKQISVDVAQENVIKSIVAKQYDNDSRFLKVRLTNEGKQINVNPTSVVTINALREDDEAKAFAGTVNEDGTVTVPITNWMLELDGQIKCDISVINTEQRKLSSTAFTIQVEAATYDGGDISDDDDYDILVKLIAEVKALEDDLKSKLANGEFKGEKGEKGDKGDTYTLTKEDKTEISNLTNEGAKEYAERAEQAYQSAMNEVGVASYYAEEARTHASEASGHGASASIYASEAKTSEENAKNYSNEAKQSAEALSNANNIFANALKGTASGEVIGMKDVSPIEHEMRVKVSGVDDLTSVKVSKLGKNLCDNVFEKGGIHNETGENYQQTQMRTVNYLPIKPNTTYTLKAVNFTKDILCRFYDKDKKYVGNKISRVVNGEPRTFTADTDCYFVRFAIVGQDETKNFLLQLELGSNATEYEPYIQPTEYTPDADGVVLGVTSLYPTTTLMTDTDGALIDATYNRDINKAFEEIKNAILSLGGNV